MGILTGIGASASENNAEVSDKAIFMNLNGDIQGLVLLKGWDRKIMFSALETAGVPYLVAS